MITQVTIEVEGTTIEFRAGESMPGVNVQMSRYGLRLAHNPLFTRDASLCVYQIQQEAGKLTRKEVAEIRKAFNLVNH